MLPLPLSYRIYLPPCYDEMEDARYPVLYLIHGQNFNDDQWDRLGVDESADALIAAEEMSPLLIVMPLLAGLFIVFALMGGYGIAVGMLGVDDLSYNHPGSLPYPGENPFG